ncbi:hypothetical protein L1049_000033 [Liquidambar formosana]|uniref:G-patch domain-containing protein n=1 Tax=Liquidambar formosana TaxID=63359 RepID=A0AAP0N3N4_LIQFO
MKLSFSLSSTKPSSKPNHKSSQKFNDDDRDTQQHQYVTQFDASKTLTDTHPRNFVIPPKENEWRPQKKMKNLELPVRFHGHDLRFEVESPSVAETLDSNMSYGLNLRQSTKNDVPAESDDGVGVASLPLPPPPIENVMLQKLKDDLDRLPEHRGLEEFNDVPVEGFGTALLAGYGWYEGRGIGKNPKGDIKVIQYEKRTAKEGLGFVSNADANEDTKTEKEEEKVRNKGDKVFVGKDVRIVGGREAGMKGRILQILSGDSIVLKLSRSGAQVEAHAHDVAELGSEEEEKCLRKLKELKIPEKKSSYTERESKESKESKDDKLEEKRMDGKRSREQGRRGGRQEEETTNQVSWLTNHIRVRIISKDLKGG